MPKHLPDYRSITWLAAAERKPKAQQKNLT
jgi:hypothetical protein